MRGKLEQHNFESLHVLCWQAVRGACMATLQLAPVSLQDHGLRLRQLPLLHQLLGQTVPVPVGCTSVTDWALTARLKRLIAALCCTDRGVHLCSGEVMLLRTMLLDEVIGPDELEERLDVESCLHAAVESLGMRRPPRSQACLQYGCRQGKNLVRRRGHQQRTAEPSSGKSPRWPREHTLMMKITTCLRAGGFASDGLRHKDDKIEQMKQPRSCRIMSSARMGRFSPRAADSVRRCRCIRTGVEVSVCMPDVLSRGGQIRLDSSWDAGVNDVPLQMC